MNLVLWGGPAGGGERIKSPLVFTNQWIIIKPVVVVESNNKLL